MENTKRIAQLFMLGGLGELSHTEETELIALAPGISRERRGISI